jgi:hypothetical protein
MFAEIALMLYLGHLLADYPFQTDDQAERKAGPGWSGWSANLTHAGTHVLVCGAGLAAGWLLLDWHLSAATAAAGLVWIGATHSFIDRRWPVEWWMQNTGQAEWAKRGGAAHIDQTAHITALILAALAMTVI